MSNTYNIVFTDTGKTIKSINTLTIGVGQELQFTIKNYAGSSIDCSGIATYKKVCIGNDMTTPANNPVNAKDLVAVDAETGTFKYTIEAADFVEADAGTYLIQITLANNVALGDATSVLRAGGAYLTVIDSISD